MTDRSSDVDDVSGVDTTGHEWDGIKELNNPLPKWWLYIFYASVVFSLVYWVLMPAWPALPGMQGHTPGVLKASDRMSVNQQMAEVSAERSAASAGLGALPPEQILADPQMRQRALAMGESLFGDNCATCHGAGGRGAKGYPALVDDIWLWGGRLQDIEYTLRHGIRSGATGERTNDMPAYGRDQFLTAEQISDAVEYVVSLSGGSADGAAIARAAPTFEKECSTCHGLDGRGIQEKGAPNLTDAEWLYGGTRADIRATIWNARRGKMPAWGERLDPAAIRSLAIYVHSFGGGQ